MKTQTYTLPVSSFLPWVCGRMFSPARSAPKIVREDGRQQVELMEPEGWGEGEGEGEK